jgi:ADP-heptose:LPS heptosyltransferase
MELTQPFSVLNAERSIQKIAIFRALFLGDLLCAVPAFRALRQRFPAAEITLIGLPWAADLVERLPYLDRLAIFPGFPGIAEAPYQPGRTSAFLSQAHADRYDLAIQMHGNGSVSNGFVAALCAKTTLGYRAGPDARLTISLPYDAQEHEALRWLRLVDAELSMNNQKAPTNHSHFSTRNAQLARLEFPIAEAERSQAAELLFRPSAAPIVGIHAGASTPERRWPAERFAALADALIERYGANITLTGTASERHITTAVRRAMRHPALDLAGETNLGVFGAVIAQLDLLLTNDTGAAHMAAAVATPSVVIFGPGRPEQWGPLDRRRHHVIDAWALAGFAGDGVAALRDLPVEPVLAACAHALQARALQPAPITAPHKERAVGSPVARER